MPLQLLVKLYIKNLKLFFEIIIGDFYIFGVRKLPNLAKMLLKNLKSLNI